MERNRIRENGTPDFAVLHRCYIEAEPDEETIMPIIVDEVVISVEVANQTESDKTTPSSSNEEEKQMIINECVQQVLDILRQKMER